MTSENRNLCETSLTIDWLREVLVDGAHLAKDDYPLGEWSARKIGVGQGFLSIIMQVELKWKRGHKNLPNTVVVKVPTLETISGHLDTIIKDKEAEEWKEKRKDMEEVFLPMAHKNECVFYDMFREKPPVPMPRSFYTRLLTKEQPGVLVMEDLSSTTVTINIAEGLRLEQVLNIANALASLHAHSLRLEDWKEKFPLQRKQMVEQFPKMMVTAINSLTDLSPELYQGKLDKLGPCLDPDFLYDSVQSNVSLGLPAVLVQGDMWINNLLFKPDPKQENGAADDLVAIIDWQIAHPGNMTEDIARVMVTSTPGGLRRKHGPAILRHYFDRLSQLMHGNVPFTFEDVLRSYRRTLPYAMTFCIVALPIMINSPVVDGPNKEQMKKEVLERGAAIIDDIIELFEKTGTN